MSTISRDGQQARKSSMYPDPLVYPPLAQPHTHTIIILHGRGSNADKFGPPLLAASLKSPDAQSATADRDDDDVAWDTGAKSKDLNAATADQSKPPMQTLQSLFPHARIVFPTASIRRAQLYKRAPIHQWFDAWRLPFQPEYDKEQTSYEDGEAGTPNAYRKTDADVEAEEALSSERLEEPIEWEKEDLQAAGLRDTSLFLRDLLERETTLLRTSGAPLSGSGRRNIIIGGLSQGAAAVLTAVLACPEIRTKIDGAFGMCGYLPFADTLAAAVLDHEANEDTGDEEDDLFERDETDPYSQPATAPTPLSAVEKATNECREILEMSPLSTSSPPQLPPIFLAHGTHDAKVDVRLGRAARRCLEAAGADVEWSECRGLGHWYSSEMLGGTGGVDSEEVGSSSGSGLTWRPWY